MAEDVLVLGAREGHGQHRHPGLESQERGALGAFLQRAGHALPPLRSQGHHPPFLQGLQRGLECAAVWPAPVHPDGAIGVQQPAHRPNVVQLHRGQHLGLPGQMRQHHQRVRVAQVVHREQQRPLGRDVLQPAGLATGQQPHRGARHPLQEPPPATQAGRQRRQAGALRPIALGRGLGRQRLPLGDERRVPRHDGSSSRYGRNAAGGSAAYTPR